MIKEILMYISLFAGLFLMFFYIISYFKTDRKKVKYNEKDLPSVTIIVPAWNEETGICSTIESLKNIEYPRDKFEILVVDDGSKDKTYENALKCKDNIVSVFKKEQNGGKFTALNFGIERARGDIIFSCDADKLNVSKNAVMDMVQPFIDPNVMCVSPSMLINDSKKILVRIQQIEYLLGIFLRNALSSLNAMSVTPGAFSAYRKTFFEKYGGFKKAHMTEDMEMCMRIQCNNYRVCNVPEAIVSTEAPYKFVPLLKQRRRWYFGQIKNLYDYRKMFSLSYGILGVVALPASIFSVFISLLLSGVVVVNTISQLISKINLLKAINFDMFSTIKITEFIIKKSIFESLSNPLFLLSLIFVVSLFGYLMFAKKYVKQINGVFISLIEFTFIFPILFFIWWIDAIYYIIFLSNKIKWR